MPKKKDKISKQQKRLMKILKSMPLDDASEECAIRGVLKMSDKKAKEIADDLESFYERLPCILEKVDKAIKEAMKSLDEHMRKKKEKK